jgi:hypothetical protein
MPVTEGTVVMTSQKGTELGDVVAKAMEDAIKQCHAEGQFAPEVIKERMLAAREHAVAAYDAAVTKGA